ncbi:c-type cytochrome [Pseudogemmobacter sonorensis]|uniref:c-type cytochrome n=1 Tax=Pseudogemmobacter sonorensis TaxID=2989681 RepID=UPI0036A900C6
MRILRNLIFLALVAGVAFWWLTRPQMLAPEALAGLTPDPARGAEVFLATGCASCHMAPGSGAEGERALAGGQAFETAFGTFHAPNISQHPEAGIGNWSVLDLANALTRGVSPSGQHLYPALPYASYAGLALQDVVDLHAHMQGLPQDPTPSRPHDLGFPFNQRLALGGWKWLFFTPGRIGGPLADAPDLTETEARGRYIAEAMAHCAECHTPRNALGALEASRWMAGAPNPSGRGMVPNITPAALDWSEDEIAYYLTTGFTPDYDSAGGHMAHVVENFARLPEDYALAVAAYLKRLPAAE